MELKAENIASQVHPAATAAQPAPTWLKPAESWSVQQHLLIRVFCCSSTQPFESWRIQCTKVPSTAVH